MDTAIPIGGTPVEVLVADNYGLDDYPNSPVNEEIIEGDDNEQFEINEHEEMGLNRGIVDNNVAVAMDQEEADEVVIIAPLVNTASIFRSESARCDSDEVIAAGSANFVPPEGWVR